jgi:hypothetical protein
MWSNPDPIWLFIACTFKYVTFFVIMISISTVCLLLGRTCCISTDVVYVKFVLHNLKDSHSRHTLIADFWRVFYTNYGGTFMVCLHTKFQTSSSIGSLVIAVKPEATFRFHAAAKFFYSLKDLLIQSSIFFEDMSPYIISGRYIKWRQRRSHLIRSCCYYRS